MLPVPFEKFIPSFFTRDKKLIAMADKIDSNLNDWKTNVTDLNKIIDPPRIQEILLNDIGNYLSAGILDTDSSRTKREKIRGAVAAHKKRGLWEEDAKPRIDSIAGGDSQIAKATESADWILFGNEEDDIDNHWGTLGTEETDTSEFVFDSTTDFILVEASDTSFNGTLGTDNIGEYGADLMGSQAGAMGDTQLGLDLIGAGDEIEIAGNIYIDVDNSILTFNEVEEIKLSLIDVVPAYYMVFLGYFNNAGQFIIYPNGIMGVDIDYTFLITSEGKLLLTSDGKQILLFSEEIT